MRWDQYQSGFRRSIKIEAIKYSSRENLKELLPSFGKILLEKYEQSVQHEETEQHPEKAYILSPDEVSILLGRLEHSVSNT